MGKLSIESIKIPENLILSNSFIPLWDDITNELGIDCSVIFGTIWRDWVVLNLKHKTDDFNSDLLQLLLKNGYLEIKEDGLTAIPLGIKKRIARKTIDGLVSSLEDENGSYCGTSNVEGSLYIRLIGIKRRKGTIAIDDKGYGPYFICYFEVIDNSLNQRCIFSEIVAIGLDKSEEGHLTWTKNKDGSFSSTARKMFNVINLTSDLFKEGNKVIVSDIQELLEIWHNKLINNMLNNSNPILIGTRYKTSKGNVKLDLESLDLADNCPFIDETKDIKGLVYLVGDKEIDIYKFGFSLDIETRLKGMKTLPFNLKIIHLVNTNEPRKLETMVKQKYSSKRIKGEWFELSESDIEEFIELGDRIILT